ncbi:hypothetical protein TWF569_000644 [Orbilia oligospora]|uniref:Uncharacterized protein n=1 Tax=Orbilia oligospora TaxID=2813651 RepID=A0A7C8JHW7_ORBOL|nr:hypothetical protein TWF706_010578 [Orbilia oligospora]KAF3091707.1 hypothetical protein TWF102_008690 [Orbilia oligospora]KAF3104321.1 hypothetical protein TWF103_006979 [Orbilia oligospora]KAF3123908.1 hypothetical protein TWF703_000618 [Orbilia oligospora]KAF3124888.1 hypothetical protein TWF594_001737 [Orbilia oligospora]
MLLSAPMATNAHRLKPAGSTSASAPSKAALAALRPSTATGAPPSSSFNPRRTAHSPTPSNGSNITTSPSTASLQSLGQPVPTPSAYTLSGLKSRLSTRQKSKGKRSFTSSHAQTRPDTSLSPPPKAPSVNLMPTANGKPAQPILKTQKSVDSAMLFTASGNTNGPIKAFSPAPTNGTSTPVPTATAPTAAAHPPSMYDTVHEIAEKRINTLDYLRRAHEGRVFWYNTVQFTREDLPRRVQPDQRKLSKRAATFFVLGQSIPSVLDLATSNPIDYLKALNSLLAEFDAYQATHDGTSTSSAAKGMGRVKLWSTRNSAQKVRRSSSAAQGGIDGLYHFTAMDALEKARTNGFMHHNPLPFPNGGHSSSNSDDPNGDDFSYLVHSSLPFEPDYYETFATLCDVLIDAYSRVLTLINSPTACSVGVGDSFIKADAKIRKTVLSTVVREFEDASRTSIKTEIVSLAKNVLGSLV